MTIQRILAALDSSPRAAAVCSQAAELAVHYRAELVLFQSVGIPPEMPPEVWSTPDVQLLDLLEKRARENLAEHAATLPASLQGKYRLRVDVAAPWSGICSAAEQEHAQLIVIGSHGYGGLDRLLGTTAAKVVNHARCSVLVVRPEL
ncbi:MAG TPA: universal stress protein [Polyangiaceae bacterium]|jgi:nucleotide-binding universal stress UspA family protein